MLPGDTKRRRDAKDSESQLTLDSHLRELPVKERVTPYSDLVFRQSAIEWLVSTDQVRFILTRRGCICDTTCIATSCV
jgi:hypothetical protein